jgi:thiol-disulfide isomerase/thioredoxin
MMRRLALLLVVCVVLGGVLYPGPANGTGTASAPLKAVVEGGVAPDFQLRDRDGKVLTLSTLRGKVVVLNFWATWCPPCRAEMPSMERLSQAMQGTDFVLLAINVEENARDAVADLLRKTPYTFPILYDEEAVVQALYGVYKFPESFVIRKDGIIDEQVIGAIDWAHPDTVAYLKALTGE